MGGRRVRQKLGRPRSLSVQQVKDILKVLWKMLAEAEGRWEVTLKMLMKRAKVKVCERAVSNALRAHNVYFRRLRGKPKLTSKDIRARYDFAKFYRFKSKAWWLKTLQLCIDLKWFPDRVLLEGFFKEVP